MYRTQRSISIKNQILNKIRQNEPTINPICPVGKNYRNKGGKFIKKSAITIEQQITSIKSIKLSRPSKTQKKITLSPSKYSISQILKSSSYRKLQKKYMSLSSSYDLLKSKTQKQIRLLTKNIETETQKAQKLCQKLIELDRDAQELKDGYYEMKRNNYQLRCDLDMRRGPPIDEFRHWNNQEESFQVIDLDNMGYEEILEMEERIGKQNVGLSSDLIQKLKVQRLGDVSNNLQTDQFTCCICCEEIDNKDDVIKLTCEHIHHAGCIKQWLKIKRFCPLCKQQVKIHNDSKKQTRNY